MALFVYQDFGDTAAIVNKVQQKQSVCSVSWAGDHTYPTLKYIETRWNSLISYEMMARLLKDILPVGYSLNASTVRNHLCRVAQHLDIKAESHSGFISDCPRDCPRYFIRTPYNGVLASQTRHDYCPQSSMIRGGDVTGSGGALVTANRGQIRHFCRDRL